ncbi:hypothetical protein BG015_010041 [Linnemannia schmuckeri]|uniref:Uncharacterized protein n=1 Tax=Linnemannia schmuckeri TaxID=64567 RepID=A0A9P5VER8_9FUNG|nr:hypothetical protein BG015_010041 [Linnemannia schmuckeri]
MAGHAALKKLLKSAFALVTLTTGSLKVCLRRATDISTVNTDLVAQRLNMTVSNVNTAKRYVFRMLEMKILRDLLPRPTARKAKSQDALAARVIGDLAPKICLDLKLYYKKLLEAIRTKMEKLEFDPADFPGVEQHTENNSDCDGITLSDDGTTLDDDADEEDPRKKSKKIVFQLDISDHAGAI